MAPEFPVRLPKGTMTTQVKWPRLECAMVRSGMRCCNDTYIAFLCRSAMGYDLIPICQTCSDEYPEFQEIERTSHDA